MKRRLQWFCSCALLCALLVTAALPAPAAAASTGFSDVPESHWAADSIRRAVDLGLFQGQTPTRFGLGAPMTRGAFVVALCRLFGWEMVTPEAGSYTDNQDKSAWYYSAVETAYANGAITRQTDTFRPREPITREELAVMLYENSDEPYCEELAKAITDEIRRGNRIDTTTKLREIIEKTLDFLPEKEKKETVKKTCQRVFQALRIDVNQEFEVLYEFMEKLPNTLRPGGRAAILTFHSGEDKLVKAALKEGYRAGIYKEYSKDVVRPSAQECVQNPRARSTKMRWAIRADE